MKSRRLALAGLVVLSMQLPAAALIELLDDGDIARALAIANGSEARRARFHAPYVTRVGDATLESIEVITEFRRFVLAAHEQLLLGNWMFARGGYDQKGRTLREHLRPFAGRVSIRARLSFHPLNVYPDLPPLDILLGEPSLLTLDVIRTPMVATSQDGQWSSIVGGTIEAVFNAPSIGDQVMAVRVRFDGRELPPHEVDFSRLD